MITADTNVLVRALTEDDPQQGAIAQAELARADQVALTMTALCELVWVLRGYRYSAEEIAAAIRLLINAGNASFDAGAVVAGLAQLEDGGDFADGVIAYEGVRKGASSFVSFDRKAVRLLKNRGQAARLL